MRSEPTYSEYLRALNQLTSAANDFAWCYWRGGPVGKALYTVADIMWRAAHAMIVDPRMLSGGKINYSAALGALKEATTSDLANSFFSSSTMEDLHALVDETAALEDSENPSSREFESKRWMLSHNLSQILARYGRLAHQLNVRVRHLNSEQIKAIEQAAEDLSERVGLETEPPPRPKEGPEEEVPPAEPPKVQPGLPRPVEMTPEMACVPDTSGLLPCVTLAEGSSDEENLFRPVVRETLNFRELFARAVGLLPYERRSKVKPAKNLSLGGLAGMSWALSRAPAEVPERRFGSLGRFHG